MIHLCKKSFLLVWKAIFSQKMFRRAKNWNSKIILMSCKRLKMTFKINYSKTPSNTAPSNTDLEVTLFWLGLKIFELHWFFRVTLFLYEFKKETLKNSTYFFHELMSCLKSFIFSNFISNQFLQNWHEIFISTSLIKVTQSVKIVLNKCERSILCFLKLCFWSNRFLQNWHENRLFIYSFVERVLSKIDMNLFSVF